MIEVPLYMTRDIALAQSMWSHQSMRPGSLLLYS